MTCRLLAAVFLSAVFVRALPPGQSNPVGLSEAIARFAEALRTGDTTERDQLLADRATWISPAGHLWTKKTILAIASRRALVDAPVKTYQHGNGAVVLMSEKENGSESISLDFWVHEQGGWTLAGRQSVMVHGKPNEVDKTPSGPAPPSAGAKAERDALLRDLEVANDAITRRDRAAWRALVTDDYISINPEGEMRDAEQLAKDVEQGHLRVLPPLDEISVRVYQDSAIVTSKSRPAGEHPEVAPDRVTRVYAKQKGRWLRAAAMVTHVVGKN